MSYIRSVKAIEILDSRGNPTLEVMLSTDRDVIAKALFHQVPQRVLMKRLS